MNRQMRRAKNRSKDKERKAQAGYRKNGITPEDLQKEYDRGFERGFNEAGMELLPDFYCGAALAAQELLGIGNEQCFEMLKLMEQKIEYALCHHALVEETLRKIGIEVCRDNPIDQVRAVSAK